MAEEGLVDALANVIARLPGGGELRQGQIDMAVAVEHAIENKRHLIVQASTGTGKTLAYLVPAIVLGVRVVVSTATKALQDQLSARDLPFLQKALPDPFEFAVLKGRSNYLCKQRAREVQGGGDEQLQIEEVATTTSLGKEIVQLVDWGRTTQTGDRSDLPFEPSPKAWSMVSVTGMECPGAAKCPSGMDCFAERARMGAEQADVIIVNTHLYGSHLASGGHVLPDHDVVIFDEAHELEDIAASSLGLEMTSGRFSSLARNARRLVGPGDGAAVDELIAAGDRFERAVEPYVNQRLVGDLPTPLAEMLTEGIERTQALLRAIKGAPDDDPTKARVQMAGGHLAGDLSVVRDVGASHVRWVEGPAHAPVLKVAPIDVGGELSERLWPEHTAILTSATVPASLAVRVGIPADEHDELDAGSPFDFGTQALLYCATHLPDPRNETYREQLHDELAVLIDAAGGRTLALFTSWTAMQKAAEEMRARLKVPILAQGDLPKPKLVDAFARDEAACLFATMGYWQGVDVPGRTLSLVTIDRIPFPRPDEPLLLARRERAGSAAFRLIDLPRAATLLAQGAGRLIRSATDHGVVAVLDSRLATANYRWDLINALPPMKRTKDREEVAAFLRRYHAAD
ncbi:MAG TPA: ATP-dependent DNA helicase [Acidimicrobiales bacterium]|nr:ATP-dependent DNA helicase [Acidimicrobiales bacterium]